MNRPIWFRGKAAGSNEVVYGYYIKQNNKEYIFNGKKPTRVTDAAQFVGVDKAGNAIYEGDVLLDELEQEHIAEIYDYPHIIANLTLKQ